MNRSLIKKLWKLGDKQFIDYALSCARLTLRERETVQYLLFDGLTQEQAAEKMDISTRGLQGLWSCAFKKLKITKNHARNKRVAFVVTRLFFCDNKTIRRAERCINIGILTQRRQKWEIAPCALSQKLQSKRGKKHIYNLPCTA